MRRLIRAFVVRTQQKQGFSRRSAIYIKPIFLHYSNICVKRPLKNRKKKDFNDKWKLNEGWKYCRMLPSELSAILLTWLSDKWSWKPICALYESGRFTQFLHYLAFYTCHCGIHVYFCFVDALCLSKHFVSHDGTIWTSTEQRITTLALVSLTLATLRSPGSTNGTTTPRSIVV